MAWFEAYAPSNIAFLKYWGKACAHTQWPANDSLSMTLDKVGTTTKSTIIDRRNDLFFLGKKEIDLENGGSKIGKHIAMLKNICQKPNIALEIQSDNSFPEACGIASSASGFCALTISCLGALTGAKNLKALEGLGFRMPTIANLARLGSGSAGRSCFSGFVLWQKGNDSNSQEIGSVFTKEHWNLCDIIVLIDTNKKAVSSSTAHALSWTSLLFLPRLANLMTRQKEMLSALQKKDICDLGELIETECLEMHSVIMTSTPAINYLSKETADFISWLRKQRNTQGLEAYFTIDAGANVHVICKEDKKEEVVRKIGARFPDYSLILDQTGNGPRLAVCK